MVLNKSMLKNKKGFTLIELIIVIAIIAILAAVLIPTMTNAVKDAKISSLKNNIANAYSSFDAARIDADVKGTTFVKNTAFATAFGCAESAIITTGTPTVGQYLVVWNATEPDRIDSITVVVKTGGELYLYNAKNGTWS